MNSDAWLDYFRSNAGRPAGSIDPRAGHLPPSLCRVLADSLGRFYLGETGEGRIAAEAARADDVALDDATREAIALYVREEGRHGRELGGVLRVLGSSPPTSSLSEKLFRRGRRLLGLRTKMMAIAAAEVVGLVYYRTLEEEIEEIAELVGAIADDEQAHLSFQAEYFARVISRGPTRSAPLRALAVTLGFVAVVTCATGVVSFGHRDLFRALGVSPVRFAGRCARQASHASLACATRRTAPPDTSSVAVGAGGAAAHGEDAQVERVRGLLGGVEPTRGGVRPEVLVRNARLAARDAGGALGDAHGLACQDGLASGLGHTGLR
jgi:hypothetical protein